MAKKIPGIRLLNLKGSETQQFVIRERETTIGSDDSNDFVVPDGSASRQHAVIRSRRGRLELADLKSTNGTFLNGVRVTTPVKFGPGDEIRFGGCKFLVLNPGASSGARAAAPRRSGLVGLRNAVEIVLFAFVVGFGMAQYLAYRVYHEENKLLLAKAVPLPPVQVNPGATGSSRTTSGAATASSTKPADPASKTSAAPVAASVPSSPELPSAPDDMATAVSLVRLVPNSGQHAGEIASDFSLPDSGGNLVNLSKYRGKVVFLNFWATWCGACRGEMASIESLYRELKDRRDFELVTVSVDQQGWSSIAPFLKSHGYDIPVLSDSDNRVSSSYGISGIPATFIIDRSGRIVWNCAGGLDWSNDTLKSALKRLFTTS